MESFRRSRLPVGKLRVFNKCRIYLRALTLADITRGDGEALLRDAWNGVNSFQCRTDLHWPQQQRPPGSDWTIWRECLGSMFNVSESRLHLPKRLGAWFDDCAPSSFLDTEIDRLYSLEDGEWVFRTPLRSQRNETRYGPATKCAERSSVSLPTVVVKRGDHRIVTGTAPVRHARRTERRNGDEWVLDFLTGSEATLEASICKAKEAIAAGTAIAVSDGSFKDSWGTAALSLTDRERTFFLKGVVVTLGGAGDQSAYRSELAGLYAIITVVDFLDTAGSIEIGCDGQEALHRSMGDRTTRTSDKHFDLIMAACRRRERTRPSWKWRHIAGHQDRHSSTLDLWAQLNCEMDAAAKAHWAATAQQRQRFRHMRFRYEPWSLWHGDIKISSDVSHWIDRVTVGNDLLKYWKKKRVLPQDHLCVDFESREKALRTLPPLWQIWTVKHTSGHCGVGKKMKLWKFWKTDLCPRCDQPEDHVHVNRCPAATDIWQSKLEELEEWMKKQGTAPYIRHLLVGALRQWHDDAPFSCTPIQREIWESQQSIGWQSFLMGWVSVHWSLAQDEFY